jgi:hypothetical protein
MKKGSPILHNIKDIREMRHHHPADHRQGKTSQTLNAVERQDNALHKCRLIHCGIRGLSARRGAPTLPEGFLHGSARKWKRLRATYCKQAGLSVDNRGFDSMLGETVADHWN